MDKPTNREELIEVIARGVRPIKPMGVFKTAQSYGVAVDALEAIEAAGLRVVPAEATEEMIHSADDRDAVYPAEFHHVMLAASPFNPPPAPPSAPLAQEQQ